MIGKAEKDLRVERLESLLKHEHVGSIELSLAKVMVFG